MENRKKILTAIKALNYTLTDGIELAKEIYSFAFSRTFALNGTPAEILDKVFRFHALADKSSEFSAEAVAETEADVKEMLVDKCEQVGDLLITEKFIYIYDGRDLVKLIKPYTEKCSLKDVTLIKYAVLRPLKILDYIPYSPEKALELSDAQKAVIGTAEQLLLRGYRLQYDDTYTGPCTFRWRIRSVSPEDYTKDMHGYSNCAAFSLDCHYFSWGYNTESMCTRELAFHNTENIISWEITGEETEKEKITIKEEFFSNLQPADIINIRYSNKSGGHAMLYAGNGQMIIHSSGKNYWYDEENPYETYEPTVKYMNISNLFDPTDRRYVFSRIHNLAIVRPLNLFNGKIPVNTMNRLKNLKGLVTEKLCSFKKYNTVNKGDEITYTFSVYNTNDYAVSVNIEDTVPEYTSLVSGDLCSTLCVLPDETKTVSYTVKINKDAPTGKYIISDKGKVGGVLHTCTALLIANTLTKDEQILLTEKVFSIKCNSPVEFVNKLYGNILSVNSIDEIEEKLFSKDENSYLAQNKTNEITAMLVPKCFGGRKILTSALKMNL